jgi:hypothetical protein
MQRGSARRSHCSCNSVWRRHLYDLGAISIELVSRGLQGCVGPRHIVSLLMTDYPNSLPGIVRTRVCGLLYQTVANRREIPLTEIQATGQEEEGEHNHIRISTGYTGSCQPIMENNNRGYRVICEHRQFSGHKTDNVDTTKARSR